MNWKTTAVASTPAAGDFPRKVEPTSLDLIAAAKRFDEKYQSDFVAGKADICRDLADRLQRFGDYASDKQREFAKKLVEWSKPRERQWTDPHAAPAAPTNELACPDLFAVMQKHSTLYVDPLRISRKNQDTLCWLLWNERLIGKIENGKAIVFPRKAADAHVLVADVIDRLREFEENPLAAAMKYGKLAGRCCSCGRDLTDPASIEAGIGPICAGKFGA